jgi:FKBP-type peptidyl-prolyl cis-trans isomerase SlyD
LHDQARLDRLLARSANSSRATAGAGSRGWRRISSGFFCQWRRMNWRGRQAAQQGEGLIGVDAGGSQRWDNCPMKITPQCVVALTWTLKDTLGETLDQLDEPVEFLVGGRDLLDKIDEALQDHQAGDVLDIHLEPEHAFGDFDDQAVPGAPQRLPGRVEEGMAFEGLPMGCTPGRTGRPAVLCERDLPRTRGAWTPTTPWPALRLRLKLKVHQVREATEAEVGQGSLGAGFFRLEAQR